MSAARIAQLVKFGDQQSIPQRSDLGFGQIGQMDVVSEQIAAIPDHVLEDIVRRTLRAIREPTEAMIQPVDGSGLGSTPIWKAMIDKALK